jgi:hypothetical protein
MVKRFGQAPQIIFTNGEFIESEIMSGKEPVIFVGKENVPDQVIDYIKANDIKTGVVIGNDLVGSSHLIKEATNVTIFLKFGQGFANIGSSEVKALDMFPIPVYETKVNVKSIQYNSETKSLEVTYENNGKIGTYFRSSIELFSAGTRIATVGDTDPVFVNRENTLTITYNKDISSQDLNSKITILFGEFPRSLDRVLHTEMPVGQISIKDNSNFSISGATYEVDPHKLKINLKNTGEIPAYGKIQVTLMVYGEEKVLTQDKPMHLDPGASGDAEFITTLSETNLEENPRVKIHLNYGERESALVKVTEGNFELKTMYASYNSIIVMLFVVIVIGILYYLRKRKKIGASKQKDGKQSSTVEGSVNTAAPATATPVNTAPVTAAPVTAAPVTAAPVNVAPVTAAPVNTVLVTADPVTAAPVNTVPVTTVPVNVAPVISVPVNTAPVTTVPVTAVPVTAAPVTTVPVNVAPVTTVPVTTVPVTAAPVNVNPISVDHVSENPTNKKNTIKTKKISKKDNIAIKKSKEINKNNTTNKNKKTKETESSTPVSKHEP